MSFGPLLAAMVLLGACAVPHAPEVGPGASADAAPPVVAGSLAVPARVGLMRMAGQRVVAVPAPEYARWRGAIAEVNRSLSYPIRVVPMTPRTSELPSDLGLVAAESGLDAILVYELSVDVGSDRLTAAIAALPLVGGAVPDSVSTRASGHGSARLYAARAESPLATTKARMTDAPVSSLRGSGGSGMQVQSLAEYALLHRMMPAAEDMLVSAVAAGR